MRTYWKWWQEFTDKWNACHYNLITLMDPKARITIGDPALVVRGWIRHIVRLVP